MAVTGAWYLVERAMSDVAAHSLESEPPAIDAASLGGAFASPPELIGVDAAIVAARQALPGLAIHAVTLPHSPLQPYVVAARPAQCSSATGRARSGPGQGAVSRPLGGDLNRLVMQIRKAVPAGATVTLALETWEGARYETSWSVPS